LTAEEKEEINERRGAARRPTSKETLAQHRANATARRNTPCAESIAMPCPNAIALTTVNPAPTTHASPARERTASPPASPSMSMPEYTIRTNGNTPIFTPFIYLLFIKAY
jgi:hypothetical protein